MSTLSVQRSRLEPPPNELEVYVQTFGRGELIVRQGGRTTTISLKGYPLKILALLVVRSVSVLGRDQLSECLWPTVVQAQARQRLNVAIHDLKSEIESVVGAGLKLFQTDRKSFGFCSGLSVSSDFSALLIGAQKCDQLTLDELNRLLINSKDEFLQVERETDWILQTRAQTTNWYGQLLLRKSTLELDLGQLTLARETAQLAFNLKPSSEEACIALMKIHSRLGSRDLAIACFDRLRRVLSDEFDMKASASVHKLAESIKHNREDIIQAPEGVLYASIRDAGSNKLIYPPPTTAGERADFTTNLEVAQPQKTFIGSSQSALTKLLRETSSNQVWIWGPPGIGKKYLLRSCLANEEVSLSSCVFWIVFSNEKDSVSVLSWINTKRALEQSRRLIVVVENPTSIESANELVNAIRHIDSNTLCIFFSLDQPKVKSISRIRVPAIETWSLHDGNIESSPAAALFCEFAIARGHANVIDRSLVSQIERIARFSGGFPGILEECAELLDIYPLKLIEQWLESQAALAQNFTTLSHSKESHVLDFCAYIISRLRVGFSDEAMAVLCILCAARNPLSLYSLADILGESRFTVNSAIQQLVTAGLVSSFRTSEHDVIFVTISGLTAKLVSSEIALIGDQKWAIKIINYFTTIGFPKSTDLADESTRLGREILRFEYVWIEYALEQAFKLAMPSSVLHLSRLLRKFYFDSGNIEAATKFFSETLRWSSSERDLADFNVVLGGLYGRAGLGNLARRFLLTGVCKSRKIGDSIREATGLHSLGLTNALAGHPSRGIRNLARSMDLYERAGLQDQKVVSGSTIAMIKINEMQLNSARKILEANRPAGLRDPTNGSITWYCVNAYLAFFEKDFQTSWRDSNISLLWASRLPFVQIVFKTQLLRSMLLIAEGRSNEAILLLGKCIPQMIFHNYRADTVHGMALLSVCHCINKNPTEALQYLNKASSFVIKVDDMQALGILNFARLLCTISAKTSVEGDWLRNEIQQKWLQIPAYVRSGILALQQPLKEVCNIESYSLFSAAANSIETLPCHFFETILASLVSE
jgi:DNA-binding SARP family transcriptional activator